METVNHPPESIALRQLGIEHGFGFLSVNHYGALVLNANAVFFGDIDCEPDPRNADKPVTPWEEAYRRVRVTMDGYGLAFRLYRTFAGLRLIETSRLHDPKAAETAGILATLGADPLYRLLTSRFGNFRVRLSPKPWRAPDCAEFHTAADVDAFEQRSSYAVARYLGTVGHPVQLAGDIASAIRLHDHFCRAHVALPLA